MVFDNDMSATEIHNFLITRPSAEALYAALDAEGVSHRGMNKVRAEAALLDLMVARKG